MERASPPEDLLHNLFEHRAEAVPANPAVLCGGQALSYRELEKQANQLARFLRSKKVGKGSVVGLLLPRSPDVYVALSAAARSCFTTPKWRKALRWETYRCS
jgi:non-ribosomal peptide synthetase component F